MGWFRPLLLKDAQGRSDYLLVALEPLSSGVDAEVAAAPAAVEDIPFLEPRETSGITSRLVLAYAEREQGRPAVEAILARCGLEGQEALLRDENHWFSYQTKIRLFEAASEVLDDPLVMRHVGECALELDVGAGLKAALRALGSPGLLYKNVVRAQAKFNTVHEMELLELGRQHARIRFVDLEARRYHPLDCQYNVGLLSCAPALFGLPPARVSHPACACDGAEACDYHVCWDRHVSSVRTALAAGAAAAASLGGSALLAPDLVPAGAVVAAAAAGMGGWRVFGVRRRRRQRLEDELREVSDASGRLASSLQDLAGELRLEEVLAKITRNAQSAVGGNEYALLAEDAHSGGYECLGSSGLSPRTVRALERWAESHRGSLQEPQLLDQLGDVPELQDIPQDESKPLRSLCSAPLLYRGEHLGVLVALGSSTRAFLPRDMEMLRSYAVQAAIAVTNARLFEAQERLAARDPLTGLLNRRQLHESIAREIERCRRHGGRWAFVLVDLDGFKLVNDASGHAVGDEVLQRVGDAVAATSRTSDLAFRLGGDEFALLLSETGDLAAARHSAERVREAITAVDPRVGASYGVAVWPDDGLGEDDLLTAADRRLYAMKGARSPAYLDGGTSRSSESRPRAALRRGHRLAVANRLSATLAPLRDPQEIADATVEELYRSFGYTLATVHRIDPDGMLRVLAARTLSSEHQSDPTTWRQSVREGVTGRVARTGEPALVADTSEDPDFVAPDVGENPRSELALPIRVGGRLWGVLNLESNERDAFDADDLLLVDTVAAQVGSALRVNELFGQVESTFTATLAVLCDALEAKDPSTAAHAREVAELSERVAAVLDIRGEQLRAVRYASLLHDIGKIGVRGEILSKPGRLTESEFAEIKQHTLIGARMLERIPEFDVVVKLVRSAHERWDGTGYPDGLAGDAIPLGARVICACDAYHAMVSDRPYRAAMTHEEAEEELRACAGSQFDPAVVDALLDELRRQDRKA